jgi:hypothetical protein
LKGARVIIAAVNIDPLEQDRIFCDENVLLFMKESGCCGYSGRQGVVQPIMSPDAMIIFDCGVRVFRSSNIQTSK